MEPVKILTYTTLPQHFPQIFFTQHLRRKVNKRQKLKISVKAQA